ncbi:MAG TPA: hypothetical protein VKU41_08385 [Polyangiaceae bacterium]|nr:hypothetical protein [Polyangiaceae bacterium]
MPPRTIVASSLVASLVAVALAACSGGGSGSPRAGSNGASSGESAGAGADAGAGASAGAGAGASASAGTAAGSGGTSSSPGASGSTSPVPTTDAGASSSVEGGGPTVGQLYWLAIVGNQVMTSTPSGSNARALVSGQGISAPDGIAVDVAGGKVYWTNMGTLTDSPHTPNGSLQRANLDGSQVEVLLQPGATTNTPKQLQLDAAHGKIYWSDREGAKAWRANLDGSQAEVILSGHSIQQLVGIALDVPGGKFYVTDRYAKTILRAALVMPSGQDASSRTDVETLLAATGSAVPVDLDLDLQKRAMYWTDRGTGMIHRAAMDLPSGQTGANRTDVVTLVSGLSTPIGISLDLADGVMFFTQLGGIISQANLDGTRVKTIGMSSGASGIAHVLVPAH